MNEENNYNPAIHTFATDKIQAKLVNLMFSIEDAKKALKRGIYGGITKQEQELILRNGQREKEIYEYILDALDQYADVELQLARDGYVWPPKIPALLKEIKNLLTDEGLNKHQKLVDKITIAIEQLNIAD